MLAKNHHKGSPSYPDTAFYAKEASRHKVLSREEEVTLARLTKGTGEAAQRAKDELFLRNMRLVLNMARSLGKSGEPQADLIQEGSIGLMRAVEKFDPEKGFRFATYASWWIRQALLRYIYSSEEIRLPGHVSAARNLVTRVVRDFPGISDSDLSEKTGLQPKFIVLLKNLPKIEGSLGEQVFPGSEIMLEDVLHDPDVRTIEDVVQDGQMDKVLTEAFAGCLPRDREIFESWMFGERALQDIGDEWGLSRERVRQIVFASTNRIRSHVGETRIKKTPRKKRAPQTGGFDPEEG